MSISSDIYFSRPTFIKMHFVSLIIGTLIMMPTGASSTPVLPTPNATTDCVNISLVKISTDYVETVALGPAAYIGDIVTVSFNVSFGALNDSVFDIGGVFLHTPYYTHSNSCDTSNNITSCNTTFRSHVSVLNTTVEVVDGMDFLQEDNSTIVTSTPKLVHFSWGSNFADFGNFTNTTLQFSVVLRVNESVTPATSYNFTAAVNLTCDSMDYGVVSGSKSLFIGDVDVIMSLVSSLIEVQAGNTVEFTMRIQPASSVLGNITLSQTKINLGPYTNFLAATLSTPTVTNSPLSQSIFSTTGFSIGDLRPGLDYAIVKVNVTVKDTIPIGGATFGGAVNICADTSFTGLKADGSTISPTGPSVQCRSVPSTGLTYQTGNSALGLGNTVNVGQILTATATALVPAGRMTNVKYSLEISSASGSCIPVKFVRGTLTVPAGVTVTGSTSIGETGFTVTGQQCSRKRRNAELLTRVKRAAPVTLTGKYPIGDITNPASNGGTVTIVGKMYYWIPKNAPAVNLDVTANAEINGYVYLLGNGSSQITQPVLVINKTIELFNETANPDHVRVNVTVMHDPSSTGSAYNVKLVDDATALRVYFSTMTPSVSQLASVQNDQIMTWIKPMLNVGEVMFMSYEAYPSNNGDDLEKLGNTVFPATLTYDSYYPASYTNLTVTPKSITLTDSGCGTRKINVITSLLYQHGLTALSFFLALLLGIGIVFLIVVVYVKVAKHGIGNEVAPSTDNLQHGLITNANHAMKKGYKNIKDQSTVDEEESLVVIHCMPDQLQKNRALDSIDIATTITADTEIEKQRYNASQEAMAILIASLKKNNDITQQMEQNALKEFMKKVKEMEANMENGYKVAMEEVFRLISIKNKEQISIILKKQKEEKDNLERKMNTASDGEKAEVFEILRKEHDIQQQDVVHLLKLEQDEESEKLRKEFAIRKRAAVKDLQRQCLANIVEKGQLDEQQADWMVKEHQKNQEQVDKIYDNEVSRQRAALDEKLTRRRMLANMAEGEEDEYSEVLNTLAEQELQVVQKLEKQGIMDEDDAERYREEIAREMIAAKSRYDIERARQEAELKKRLKEAKKQKLAEKAKLHQQELAELQKKQEEEKKQENIDPIAVIELRANMTSKHRAELLDLENQIDHDQTKELLQLREKVTDQTKEELETNRQVFLDKLKSNGFMEDEQIKQIIKQHNLQLNKLEMAQQSDREKQQENLQRKLKEKKRELQQRREAEKLEQEQIREYEKNLTKKILDNQVAVSDEERDRIMKEHEKQMVKLENSLTLNKLHQKRMLEKKLADKRAKHMETLEKKQLKETKRVEKKLKTADEEEEEQHQATIDLMKKHAEQKLAVLQGDKLKLEEEMDQIREDMVKERAAALKAQEDQLGAMVAEMQLKKAEELSKIDQQQKAIFNLKSSLMEELNTQGVMSDPDTQRVLEKHQEQQEQLNKKLEQQKERQQRLLQEKLTEKMMQREKTMMLEHEDQLKTLLKATSNKTAARFKAVSLKIKQASELEVMKNDATTEINQRIESMKREFNIKHMQAIQQKELEFISGLVKVGQFNEKEIEDMVNWLFPMKDTEEKKQLVHMVYQGDPAAKKNERPKTGLGERARMATLAHVTPEASRKKSAKKSAKKRQPSARRHSGLDEEQALPPVSAKGRRRSSTLRQ